MLNGLTSILRDTIDSANPLHFKIYEEYFSQATSVIDRIKDEFLFDDGGGELRQLGKSDEVTKLDTKSMIKPGALSLTDFEAYLDQNRTKLHIAHSHKQFHALLNKWKNN